MNGKTKIPVSSGFEGPTIGYDCMEMMHPINKDGGRKYTGVC